MRFRFAFFALMFCCLNSVAQVEMLVAPDFKMLEEVAAQVGNKKIVSTLIVMDDDDTLTMMSCRDPASPQQCQYLGGPAWYSWQSDLMSSNPASPFLVAKSSQELLAISTLLLALNDMPYTQTEIPDVLQRLTAKGAKLLVLTARGPSNVSATEQQFGHLHTAGHSSPSFLNFIKSHALVGTHSGKTSFPGPLQPKGCTVQRDIVYQQGVMYVAGQNKGDMLHCFLRHTQSSGIKNILFIDDTLQNVEDVFAAFEKGDAYNVKALHYTYLQQHKARLTEVKPGEKSNPFQEEARRRWQAIKDLLNTELLDPAAL